MEFQTICVIGMGYIGLPSAALLASNGNRVIGCDVQPHIVDTINKGCVHLHEPALELLVHNAVVSGKLSAQLTVPKADVYVITVPTPVMQNNEPDISFVKAAIESIAPQLVKNNLIILESTSPVGTTEKALQWILQLRDDLDESLFYLAYCPERVMPGQILRELVDNDRVVGGVNPESTQQAIRFYQLFVKGNCIPTTAKTAEMTKLTENAYRDVNIAFANELSMICDHEGINVWELIALANHHPRVQILQPGAGVGGHCIAVDPWFIVASNPEQSKLIRSAREVNNYKAHYVLETILNKINHLENPTIACLGITFKKNVDDLRESPALAIVNQLCKNIVGSVLVVEPNIKTLPQSLQHYQNVMLVDLEQALTADIVVLLVAHSHFKNEKLLHYDPARLIDVVGLTAIYQLQDKVNHYHET